MAVPGLSGVPNRASATAALLLFERLPDRIFAPLASANRHRYWDILCYLHARRFGPDAPLPPSRGYTTREIIADIEDTLLTQDAWEGDEALEPETPINIRAIGVFNRLLEAGWFKVDRPVFSKHVTMIPVVSQFLTVLVSFAETGPVFVSGKIRSIDVNVQLVAGGEGTGDSLSEAAEQARHLLEHVRNTGTNIRDIMDSLGTDIPTAQYVQRFFGDYIERVFIGDYRELRTKDHPLSRRAQILQNVEDIYASSEQRCRLVAWYEAYRSPGNRGRAERLFQRDIDRLFELQKIGEYLDRLDDEIRRANKRALAFLDYRLRSLQPVDHLVRGAIGNLIHNGLPTMADPFAPQDPISGERLAEPRRVIERAPPAALRKPSVSDAEKARARVMLRAREARSITPPKLAAFINTQLDGRPAVQSQALALTTVTDVRAYQALGATSLAMGSGNRKLQLAAMTHVRGARVLPAGSAEEDHPMISGRPFVIESRRPPTPARGKE